MKTIAIEPIQEDFGATVRSQNGTSLFDLNVEEMIGLFKEKGVLLFTGFGPDLRAFEKFSDRFSTDWMHYDGGAHERRVLNPDSDRTIYSVNFYFGRKEQVMFELPVHADMSYLKHHPKILFFYSIQPARTGGETAIVDGLRVYREMSEPTKRLFATKKIKYIRKYFQGGWQLRFGTDDLEKVMAFCRENEMALSIDEKTMTLTTEYATTATPRCRWGGQTVFCNSIAPVIWQEECGKDNSLVRLEDGSKIPPDVIEEMKSVLARNRVLVPLKKSEILLVDNTRVLHGRMTFDDPARDVAIRMGGNVAW